MKKNLYMLILATAISSCINHTQKKDNNPAENDTVAEQRNDNATKPADNDLIASDIPEGYTQIGDIHSDTLTYTGFTMGDLAHFTFQDKKGNDLDINKVNEKYELLISAKNPSDENGGYDPNPEYLNKEYIVLWRTLKLNHEPKDEMEMYYQEYNELIHMKKPEK